MRFPIAPTERYRDVVDARDHVAVAASLRAVLRAAHGRRRSARRARRGSIGGELFRNILEADFHGAAYPVNLKGEPVAGVRGVSRPIGEIRQVDLAVLCLPGEHVLPAAAERARGRRARARRHLRRLRRDRPRRASRAGSAARAGALPRRAPDRPELPRDRAADIGLNATFALARLPVREDRLLVAERRARARAARDGRGGRGLGLSSFVSIGTRRTSPRTTCSSGGRTTRRRTLVLLYLESFGNPRTFARIARRLARARSRSSR